MAINRYTFVNSIRFNDKTTIATNLVSVKIFRACNSGDLPNNNYVLQDGERLDTIAGRFYGDASYWWVIAAASGVGWGMQVPSGTLLRIPSSLSAALAVAG
tara:strand:+ start:157 stop:459 length:303 start_codon:yes stop_codon:yes gene_type:complete